MARMAALRCMRQGRFFPAPIDVDHRGRGAVAVGGDHCGDAIVEPISRAFIGRMDADRRLTLTTPRLFFPSGDVRVTGYDPQDVRPQVLIDTHGLAAENDLDVALLDEGLECLARPGAGGHK